MKRLFLICICILIAIPAWAKGPQKRTDIENTIQAYDEIIVRYGDIEKISMFTFLEMLVELEPYLKLIEKMEPVLMKIEKMEPAFKKFENTQNTKDE